MSIFELEEGTPAEKFAQIEVRNRSDHDGISGFREELDSYYQAMLLFNKMDPVEVFQTLSQFSARASEIRMGLMRVDNRKNTSFRTHEIDPFISECDRQFKLHSRIQAIKEMDARLSGGSFA